MQPDLRSRSALLSALLMLAGRSGVSAMLSERYVRYEGYGPGDCPECELSTRTVESATECAKGCNGHLDCTSFTHWPGTGQCILQTECVSGAINYHGDRDTYEKLGSGALTALAHRTSRPRGLAAP